MCLRPKLLPLDRGYMHPCLEAAVLGDMHVQGEEVDKGRRSNMCLPIAASCFLICYLSCGRLIPHVADLNLPYSSHRLIEGCASAGASPTMGKEGSEVTAIALGSWKP
ncbi:hypothetical protein ACQJBY_058372 [Aegilops geniculata]